MINSADWPVWIERAGQLMAANRVTLPDGRRYTAPSLGSGSPDAYANQALWDSCFHAILLRWFDPDMARDELLCLASAQLADGPDAGMIPHLIYWRGGAAELWGRDSSSLITQPPLIAVAAMRVHAAHPDRALLEALYPRLCAFHDWFDRRRDPDGDELVCLIHPWESGWDASPRWDRALGLDHPTHDAARAARLTLPARLIAQEFDAATLLESGSYCVEPVDFNALRAADLDALAQMAAGLGRVEEAAHWQARADRVRAAMQVKLFHDLPYDLDGADERLIRQESAAQFVTLVGGCATPEQAARLVALLREPRHWPTFPIPTTPTTADVFAPERYWRGNVWLNVNWLVYQGLRRYGYTAEASALAQRSLALVEQTGFWEYYHPLTGDGLGAAQYSWSAIVLDLLACETGRCALLT